MKNIILIVGLILIVSCNSSNQNKIDKQGEIKIEVDSLNLEKITLPNLNSSFEGTFFINDDQINYLDKRFGWVFIFNTQGELIEKAFGQGEGPSEINTGFIDSYFITEKGEYMFLGSSFDMHLHDKNYVRKSTFTIGWEGNQNINQVREKPLENLNEFALYTLDYQNLHLKIDNRGNVFIPIYAENEMFNAFIGDKYYKEGKILAKFNMKSKKVEKLFGNRSEEYLSKKNLPHHAWFRYDVSTNGNIYLNHEIDQTIYVYDNNFNELYRFGFKGKDMDLNYQELGDYDLKEFRKLYFEDRPKRGFYSTIKVFEEKNLLFRSYKKGGENRTDGVQIYKDKDLIADVAVPKGFEVIGYIEPYYYGQIILEGQELDEFNLFKFKL